MGVKGQIYFGWADYADLNNFGPAFYRWDEKILAAEIIHEEGQIPVLNITIKTRVDEIGWLSPGRKQWAWLAYDDGEGTVTKLFFGRLIGMLRDFGSTKGILSFTAKAPNSEEQKRAVAETLRNLPGWDPVWYSEAERDDPNKALEGYSVSWHVDRTSLEWTVSDDIVGDGDPEVFIGAGDVVWSSFNTEVDQPPLTDYKVDANVTYKQRHSGQITVPPRTFTSVVAEGFLSGWPKSGTQLSGGYSVVSASATDAGGIGQATSHTVGFKYENQSANKTDGDTVSADFSLTEPVHAGQMLKFLASSESSFKVGDPESGQAPSLSMNESYNYVPTWVIPTTLVLGYEAARDRTEHITFNIHSNQQPLFNDVGSEQIEVASFQGADVGQDLYKIDATTGQRVLVETMPIGDPSRRSYFTGARGIQSIQNRLLYGRAKVLRRSRALRVSWKTSFARAINLSCRKSALIQTPRLPGGQAVGKIIRYTINLGGGSVYGTVTIGVNVGYGQAVEAQPGTPTWGEVDFADNTLQVFENEVRLVGNNTNIGFTVPIDTVNDDGLTFPLNYQQVVVSDGMVANLPTAQDFVNVPQTQVTNVNGLNNQFGGAAGLTAFSDRPSSYASMLMAKIAQQQAALDALARAAALSKWRLELKPLTGSFEYAYDIETTNLEAPQGINLGYAPP